MAFRSSKYLVSVVILFLTTWGCILTPVVLGTSMNKPNSLNSFFDSLSQAKQDDPSNWHGRWFPSNPNEEIVSPHPIQKDEHGRIKMGVANSQCDDAKTNLTVDWNESVINYTCFHPETRFPLKPSASYNWECEENLSEDYKPRHFCMNETIEYDHNIPTYGDHRPLWPVFGEYVFVPRQRWLHNIEHGAVVMLYHPCAYTAQVQRLREIVTGCIGKHIITPSNLLDPEYPLALVAWGCRVTFSVLDEDVAVQFITQKGHHGPEGKLKKEGQFTLGLYQPALQVGNGKQHGYEKIECSYPKEW